MKWVWILIGAVLLGGGIFWRIQSKEKGTAEAGQRMAGMRTPTVQIQPAGPGRIVAGLDAVGNVESPNQALISPRITGRIEQILVREGDKVSKGQLLVRLDPSEIAGEVAQRRSALAEAQSRLAQAKLGQNSNAVSVRGQIDLQKAGNLSAEADLNQAIKNTEALIASADQDVKEAEAKLNSAKSQVASAKAELAREEANLDNQIAKNNRAIELLKQGFISQQAADDARTAVEVQRQNVNVASSKITVANDNVTTAQAQLNSAKEQLGIVKRKAVSDVAAARARSATAKANLNVARANSSQTSAYRENLAALESSVSAARAQLQQSLSRMGEAALRAPMDGVVSARNADPGSLATASSPILTIQSQDWLFVRSSLPVESYSQVYVGQPVAIALDALPKEELHGQVSQINGAADEKSRQIEILIKLPNPDGKLKPGMFGHLRIVTSQVEAAVALPREAVKTDKEGVVTVAVVDDKLKVNLRKVVLGIQNDKLAEIKSGVSPGEKVVILAYDQLRDGQTVQLPRKPGEGRPGGQSGQGGPRGKQ